MKNKLYNFDNFLNEIYLHPKKIDYEILQRENIFFDSSKTDYLLKFKIRKHEYVLWLIYSNINGIMSYEILLTTTHQLDNFELKLKEITDKNIINNETKISDDDFNDLKSIVEKETNFFDFYDIMNSVSYILLDFHKKFIFKYPLLISETDNKKKIKIYRNLIKHTFNSVIETKSLNNEGKNIFYYKII